MKRRIIIGALLAITIGGVSAAWTASGCDCRPDGQEGNGPPGRGPGPGNKEHHDPHFAQYAPELGLSDVQRAKIERILQAERDKSAPLRKKLEDNRQQLRKAELAAKFDEAAVRTIAARQAQLVTEMMVARARAHNQILSLMTPEQRTIAEKLRPPMEERGPGHFPPPGVKHGPWDMPR